MRCKGATDSQSAANAQARRNDICRFSEAMRKVMPDTIHPSMWRVQWPDGSLSDMANLTRAKDAAACFMETEERRQRGWQSQLEARPCVKACAGDEDQIHLPEGKRPCTGMSENAPGHTTDQRRSRGNVMLTAPSTALLPAGRRFGHWRIVNLDPLGRRACCWCRCGVVRQVAVADLLAGRSNSCGCVALPATEYRARREEEQARRRVQYSHINWRPQG